MGEKIVNLLDKNCNSAAMNLPTYCLPRSLSYFFFKFISITVKQLSVISHLKALPRSLLSINCFIPKRFIGTLSRSQILFFTGDGKDDI